MPRIVTRIVTRTASLAAITALSALLTIGLAQPKAFAGATFINNGGAGESGGTVTVTASGGTSTTTISTTSTSSTTGSTTSTQSQNGWSAPTGCSSASAYSGSLAGASAYLGSTIAGNPNAQGTLIEATCAQESELSQYGTPLDTTCIGLGNLIGECMGFFWYQTSTSTQTTTTQVIKTIQINQIVGSASSQMSPSPPTIGTAPTPQGIVNLATWLWVVAQPPISTTSSAQGVSVTAVATPTSITWNMGDGNQITCPYPGWTYNPNLSWSMQQQTANEDGQACFYTYTSPGNYSITATVNWSVTYTVSGAPTPCGQSMCTLPAIAVSSSKPLNVYQIESIVTQGG
ncbi:MAG: hypothetical protein M1483_06415 [Actinobacteria bacterium]|nr:hypothetical protein [Actinomycetota bacterium]MCL6105239.1 hypothetical protein [Actinomycetota bacterium]